MLGDDVQMFLKPIVLNLGRNVCYLLLPYDLQLFLYKPAVEWGTFRHQL